MTEPERSSKMPVRSVALVVAGFMCMGIGMLVGLETLAGMVRFQGAAGAPSSGSSLISLVYANNSALFLKYSLALMLAGALIVLSGYVMRLINKRHN